MDKWVGCNQKNQLEVDMWHEKTILLTQLDPIVWMGEKREKRERKEKGKRKEEFRERDSTFSLNFPVIGPSILVGARREVAPHCKSYTWVPILWSFENSGR